MCIIIAKPAGVEMPEKDILTLCAMRNHDGCGFATPTRVYHNLNYLTFQRELDKVGRDEPCIIHFRWATHGSVKRANCHPFFDPKTGIAFAHNGVLNIDPIGDMTDSETAFKTRLLPVIRQYGLESRELAAEVRHIIGYSKFAFLDKAGDLRMFGPYHRYEGCYYSNLNF